MDSRVQSGTERPESDTASGPHRIESLRECPDFGPNPGQLRLFIHIPSRATGVATSRHAHAGMAAQGNTSNGAVPPDVDRLAP